MRRHGLMLGIMFAACFSSGNSENSLPPSKSTQEIIGGIIDLGRPYVVGVGSASFGIFCSGTVISRRTVITAGHCFGGIDRIFLGPTGNTTLSVIEEVRHPGFSNFTLTNDIAVLRLAIDAPVEPAPLLRETMNNSSEFIGPEFSFVGFGISDNGNPDFGVRRVVTFPIEAVGPSNVGGTPGFIDNTQFYYQVPGENTCNGDSGGPAFVPRNGVERHAGVTSFGDGPCAFDGVQARTDGPQITNFIQDKINQFEAGDPCRANGVCNESCNTGGVIVDADCAENHCGVDGVCAIACVLPMDEDCRPLGIDHCSNDGVCDPLCQTLDVDCTPLCTAEGTCVESCGSDPDCSSAICGDAIVEFPEECDDANTIDIDGCRNDCSFPFCGDSLVSFSEECDDGNAIDIDGCRNDCTLPFCGDNIVSFGEECDDGNTIDIDGCRNDCSLPTCGDGLLDNGEACDDGNAIDIDGCRNDCSLPFCGDGILDISEVCDDANNRNADGCRSDCTGIELCGDTLLDFGEACDDGNAVNEDECRNTCTLPFCGDGILDNGEACDDGNTTDIDGCRNDCSLPFCGDGILDNEEECDDNNTQSEDGCDINCLLELSDENNGSCSIVLQNSTSSPFILLLLGLCFSIFLKKKQNPFI